MKRLSLLLLPVGPVCVALLRLLLPYYTAPNDVAAAQAVIDHPGRESAVLWLGLAAVLTLLPGLYTLADSMPSRPLKTTAMLLAVPGYLCLALLLVQDNLLYSAARTGTDPHRTAALLAALHPSVGLATDIFVVGHVLGTLLLGVALLRWRQVGRWAAWLITISQPLHVVAFVVLGSPVLDFAAWLLMALGLAEVARTRLFRPSTPLPSSRALVDAA